MIITAVPVDLAEAVLSNLPEFNLKIVNHVREHIGEKAHDAFCDSAFDSDQPQARQLKIWGKWRNNKGLVNDQKTGSRIVVALLAVG